MTLPDAVRDIESAPFFDGTRRGELMVKRCGACGHHVRGTAMACAACHGPGLTWVAASGRGSLVTWTVLHGRGAPTVAAVVELDEGPWLHARLVDVEADSLRVGTRFVVEFVDAGEERVPVFRPEA